MDQSTVPRCIRWYDTPMHLLTRIALLFLGFLSTADAYWKQDGAFVRSGRTMFWRRLVPVGLDTSRVQPVQVFFHGDHIGQPSKILDDNEWMATNWSLSRGAIAVEVVSPDTIVPDGDHRFRGGKDDSLVLQAIRSGFDGAMKIDTSMVVFHGLSSGSVFLDGFLQRNRVGWGGGVFIECGGHNILNDPMPDPVWASKFRVFVATAKDDFMYSDFLPIAEHAKYWSGFDVRQSNQGGGGHCTTAGPTKDSAFDWIYRKAEIPKPLEGAHWIGILPKGAIVAVSVSTSGQIWVGTTTTTPQANGKSSVWSSKDDGATWQEFWTSPDSGFHGLGGLANLGRNLVISHGKRLVLKRADGSSRDIRIDTASPKLLSDMDGRLWIKGATWSFSADTGATWIDVPSDWTVPDQFARGSLQGQARGTLHFVRLRDSIQQVLVPDLGVLKADSVLPPVGRILTSVRSGDSILATVWNGSKQVVYTRIAGKWSNPVWPSADGIAADTKVSSPHAVEFVQGLPVLFGTVAYQGTSDGKWNRMVGGWWYTNAEPGAIGPTGKLYRVVKSGFGLQVWTPTQRMSSPIVDPRPGSTLDPHAPRRVGRGIQLPPDGGDWTVTWLDPMGRQRHVLAAAPGTWIADRPTSLVSVPLWLEIQGPRGRWIYPASPE